MAGAKGQSERSQRSLAILRISLHALAGSLTVIAVSLIISGIATPAWQVVNITQLKIYREHGLWMVCVYGTENYDSFHHSQSGGVACSLQMERSHHPTDKDHSPDHWAHVTTLALLCTASALGVIGFAFFCCACCCRSAYIVWTINTAICSLMSATGVILFFYVSQEFENRVLHQLTEIYEQKVGYSFWLAVGGTGVFILCLLVNVLCSVLVYIMPVVYSRFNREWLVVTQQEDTLV